MAKDVVKEQVKAPMVSDVKPDWLVALEAQGPAHNEDNFDNSDIVVPRIKLLQGLSKEVEAHNDAKPGVFWHTGLDLNLGTELDFVVCSRKKKYLLVAPMEDGQGILARAEDFLNWDKFGEWDVKLKGIKTPVKWSISSLNVEESGLAKWGSSNPADPDSPPAATLFYEYLVLLPNRLDLGPAVLSLARSQIKKAKRGLNDKIKLHEKAGRPMQAIVFQAKPVDDQNPDGQAFKNFQFLGNGFASKELYEAAMDLRNSLTNYAVGGEEEAAHEEQAAGGSADSKEF